MILTGLLLTELALAVAMYRSGTRSDPAGRGLAQGIGALLGIVALAGLAAALLPFEGTRVLAWCIALVPVVFALPLITRLVGDGIASTYRERVAADFPTEPLRRIGKAVLTDNAAAVAQAARGVATLDERGARGRTLLLFALQRKCLQAARALLVLGANPNVAAEDGTTPMTDEALSDPELLELMLAHGGDPAAKNRDGDPLGVLVVRADYVRALERLLDRGLSPKITAQDGETLLAVAVRCSAWRCASALLRAGADPLQAEPDGSTVLARFRAIAHDSFRAGDPAFGEFRRDLERQIPAA